MKNKNLADSFKNAITGVAAVFKNERNFKIHVFAAVIVFIVFSRLGLSLAETLFLLFSVFFVFVTEQINTAIERAVDLACGEKYSPVGKAAKDIAAGAVLISCVCAGITGAIIFADKVFSRL